MCQSIVNSMCDDADKVGFNPRKSCPCDTRPGKDLESANLESDIALLFSDFHQTIFFRRGAKIRATITALP